MAEKYGNYELTRLIATGGMAEVYLARQLGGMEGFTRNVVVKRMLPQLAVRPDFVQMFLDEARLAAIINHPNVVSVYDLGEVDDSYYIAMEFVDGPHLGSLFAHSLRQRRPLPIEQCVYIVARAADGLHYAHELRDPMTHQHLNIVHRDISPQNVLVSRQGDVKVTDFGVAKSTSHQTKTRTGIIKGKVAYMSPEQCLGETVDRRTDVFALGVVLYELLTRKRLFRDKSDLLIMQKITGEDVPPPSTVNKEVDEELDTICAKALARIKEYRYQSAAEVAEALDLWLAAKGFGDVKAALQRWFEQNALELSITYAGSSSPSISAPSVRAEGPTAQTVATPSLSSMEPLLRSPPRTGSQSGPKLRPGRSETSGPHAREGSGPSARADAAVELTRQNAASDGTSSSESDSLVAAQSDSDRQASADAAERNTSQDDPVPVGVSAARGPMKTSLPHPARLDDPTAQSSLRKPRSLVVGIAAGAGLAAVAAIAIVVVQGNGMVRPEPPGLLDAGPMPTPAGALAKVRIETIPPGVTVLINDEKVVKSPAEIEHPPGKIKLQAQFKDQAPVEEEAELEPGVATTLKLIAKVPLIVKTRPPRAEVRVGDMLEGETPLEKQALLAPEKPVQIRIELNGYRVVEKTVTPTPGEPVVIDETLAPLARTAPPLPARYRQGVLNMRSTPWVHVKLQSTGDKLGATTFTGVKVPSGKQTLILTNPEYGINEALTVAIPEEKALNVILEFEKKGSRWVLKSKNIRGG